MTSTQDSNGKVSGSCACRHITFNIPSLPIGAAYCYCRECAKASGAGYIPFAHFRSTVEWSNTPAIWKSSVVADRGYCKECGSTIYMRMDTHPDEISIAMSAIDTSSEPLPKPEKHIFLKEKVDWVHVPEDNADRFDQYQPALQTRFDEMKRSRQ